MTKMRENFLEGAVKLEIRGTQCERFVNLCKSGNLYLWSLQTGESNTFWISVEDFFQLGNIRRKTGCHVKIMEKYGLPFLLHRYRKRQMFFAGMAAAFFVTYILSLSIWDLSVTGNYTYTDEEILAFLKELNITAGMKIEKIDCDAIEKEVRNRYFDITWVSVEVSGTRLIVHIKENEQNLPGEELNLSKEDTDIVAAKEGEITEIEMRSGTLMVKRGMMVNKGDILVYGHYDILDDAKEVVRTQYLTADADIYAKVVYPYEYHLPLAYEKKNYTGEKNSYGLRFTDRIVEFPQGKEKGQTESILTEKQCSLYKDFYLPVTFYKKVLRSYETEQFFYTEEEAKRMSEEKLSYFLQNLEKNTIQIIENNVTIEIMGDECVSTGTITAIEEIGTPAAAVHEEELTGETSTDYE